MLVKRWVHSQREPMKLLINHVSSPNLVMCIGPFRWMTQLPPTSSLALAQLSLPDSFCQPAWSNRHLRLFGDTYPQTRYDNEHVMLMVLLSFVGDYNRHAQHTYLEGCDPSPTSFRHIIFHPLDVANGYLQVRRVAICQYLGAVRYPVRLCVCRCYRAYPAGRDDLAG